MSGIVKAFVHTQSTKCTRLLFSQPFFMPVRHGTCRADMSRNSTSFTSIVCAGSSISISGTGSLTPRFLTMLSSWASTPIYARPNCAGLTMCWGWVMNVSQSAYCVVSLLREWGLLGARRSTLKTLWRLLLKTSPLILTCGRTWLKIEPPGKAQCIMVQHLTRANEQAMQ